MEQAVEYGRYGLAETKDHFSALTAQANATGRPFTVLKGGKPWVEVRPLAARRQKAPDTVSIVPVRRNVAVADLDELFGGYSGGFVPREDGFAAPAGSEEM